MYEPPKSLLTASSPPTITMLRGFLEGWLAMAAGFGTFLAFALVVSFLHGRGVHFSDEALSMSYLAAFLAVPSAVCIARLARRQYAPAAGVVLALTSAMVLILSLLMSGTQD